MVTLLEAACKQGANLSRLRHRMHCFTVFGGSSQVTPTDEPGNCRETSHVSVVADHAPETYDEMCNGEPLAACPRGRSGRRNARIGCLDPRRPRILCELR